jgi:hypothetical protein
MKPLMEMEDDTPQVEKKEKSGAELDASLIYELTMRLLSKPEAREQVVSTVSQASDVGTAIGKMAGMIVMKVADEMEARGMPVADEAMLGASGGLARVLTAIYQVANEEGLDLPMQDSIIQAFETAEADLENMVDGGEYAQQRMG